MLKPLALVVVVLTLASGQTVQAQSATAEIQAVIQRANQEQAQALATGDNSLMSDTSTGAYWRQLVDTNQSLVASGVTSIALTDLEWGPITISGANAQATDFETWLTRYSDGTTTQATNTNIYALTQSGATWLIQADLQTPGVPQSSPAPAATPTTVPAGASTSQNWAGYVASQTTVTGVTGTWSVPQPSSATTTAGAGATWVGIGGFTNRDLIQAGTQDVTSSGQHQFQTWIERLPSASQQLPVAVAPGDSVTVSIMEQGDQASGVWLVSLMNNSSGQSFSTTISYPSSDSSAEWIVEAPSTRRGILPLDSFGSVQFTDCTTVIDGESADLRQAGAQPITLTNANKQAIAVPSPITSDGFGFTVTRTSAPSLFTGGVLASTLR